MSAGKCTEPHRKRACGRYGSYEACVEPHFELEHLPLIDRGFVYALAHVRGGGELGRLWHEDGKFLKKRNTFTDFIACAEHLVALDYTRPELLCAEARAAYPTLTLRLYCVSASSCISVCSLRVSRDWRAPAQLGCLSK